ncbi:hypothetical protein Fot_20822 [Forsythia ovata]|uniref:Uncharacterized protein n=1 Tax=Forsythia ovata TaxID=205694 RepID=A0ABD1UT26_9LAMI
MVVGRSLLIRSLRSQYLGLSLIGFLSDSFYAGKVPAFFLTDKDLAVISQIYSFKGDFFEVIGSDHLFVKHNLMKKQGFANYGAKARVGGQEDGEGKDEEGWLLGTRVLQTFFVNFGAREVLAELKELHPDLDLSDNEADYPALKKVEDGADQPHVDGD